MTTGEPGKLYQSPNPLADYYIYILDENNLFLEFNETSDNGWSRIFHHYKTDILNSQEIECE